MPLCDVIQPSHPQSSPSPPAFNFPSLRVFSHESALCIRWPKQWRFSISPSNEYSGLISFRIDWFDLLPIQGTLKSFLQHHSSKASILRHSAFFTVQLSRLYMITGKSALTTQSEVFNTAERTTYFCLPAEGTVYDRKVEFCSYHS